MRRLSRQKQTNKQTTSEKTCPLYLFNRNDDYKNNKNFISLMLSRYNYLKLRRLLAQWQCTRKRNYIFILLTFLSSRTSFPRFVFMHNYSCRWVSAETSAPSWERMMCLSLHTFLRGIPCPWSSDLPVTCSSTSGRICTWTWLLQDSTLQHCDDV